MAVINTPNGGMSVRGNSITDAINNRYGQSKQPTPSLPTTPRNRGGGGSSNKAREEEAQRQAEEQARLKADAETQRLAQLQADAQARQQEVIRQEQIQTQRVAEQQRNLSLGLQAQNEIHKAQDNQPRFTQGFWTSTKQALGNVFNPKTYRESQADKLTRARSVTTTDGPAIDRPSAWASIIAPYQDTGKTVGETNSNMVKQGTIVGDNPFYTKKEIVDKQAVDVQIKIMGEQAKVTNAYKADLTAKQEDLQNRINAGTMDVDTATKILDETNKNLSEKYNTQLKDNTQADFKKLDKIKNQYGNLGESTASRTAKAVPQVADIALTTGLTIANPIAGSAYLGTTGLVKGYELGKKQQEGYKVTLGEKIDVGSRLFFAGTVGTKVASKAIERGIIREQVSSLGTSPLSFKQVQVLSEKEGLVAFTAKQKYGGLTREIQGTGKIMTTNEGSFIIPKGEVISRTSGKTWNILGSKSGTSLLQYEKSIFGTKGVSATVTPQFLEKSKIPFMLPQNQVEQLGAYSFGVSKSTVEPVTSTSALIGKSMRGKSLFTSTTTVGGNPISSLGFSVSKKVAPDVYGNERFISSGLSSDTKLAVQPQRGVTTVIRKPAQDKSSMFFGSGVKSDSKGTSSLFSGETKPVSSLGLSAESLSPVVKQSETSLGSLIGDVKPSARVKSPTPRTTTRTVTETKSQGQSLGLMDNVLVSEKPRQDLVSVTPPIVRHGDRSNSIPNLSTGILQAPLQSPKQFQPPLVAPRLMPKTFQTPKIGYTPSIGFGLPIAPNLGTIDTGNTGGRRTRMPNVFGKTTYNPSLGAVLTKQKKRVSKKEASLLSNAKYSGLENRPLLEISSEKKTRKKR